MTKDVPLRLRADVMLGRMRDPSSETGPLQVPYLRAANVDDGSLNLGDVKSMHFDVREQKRYRLLPGDVLVSEASGSRGQVGQSAYVDAAAAGMVFQNTLLRLRPQPGTDGRFLFWWSRYAFASGLYASASQGLGIWHLGAERARGLPFPDMPTTKQRRVAGFLDDQVALVDRAIRLRQKQIELLEQRQWSTFLEAVEKVPFMPLRRVIAFATDGPFGSAFASSDYADVGPAVIRLGNIGFAMFKGADLARVSEEVWSRFPRCHVREGDLLVASLGDPRNHAGRACLAPDLGPAMVKGKCFCVRLHGSQAYPDYVALLLSSPLGAQRLAVATRGATRGMINLEILRAAALPLPTRDVQEEISVRTRAAWRILNSAMASLARSTQLLEERKQALITAAVTGQFDVFTASARSVA